jgi:hypothetical protein
VVALQISDPVEQSWPTTRPVVVEDAESGLLLNLPGGKEHRQKLDMYLAESRRIRQELCRKAQVDLVEVEKDAAQDSSQKKVEIDHLSINGLSVKFAFIKIPIPPISISNLGKDTGGISLKGLWSEILSIVMKSAGAVGGAVSDFGASLLNGTSNAAQDAANVLIDAGSSVKDIGKSLKNFFK